MEGIATKPLKTIQVHHQTLRPGIGLTYGSITKDSNINLIHGYHRGEKGLQNDILYLLYFQRYECFRTENHKKWLNSVGLMVLTYLNTLATHGASKKMIFFHF